MIYLASLTERIEDKIMSYYIIKTKEELDKIVADNTQSNRVIIRGDFAKEYFTPSGILKFIDNSRRVNRNLIIELDEQSNVITDVKFINKLRDLRNLEEIIMLATSYPKEFLDSIKILTSNAINNRDELLASSSTVSRLQSIIDTQKKEIDDLEYTLKIEQENKFNSSSKLNSLVNRINYQYNLGIEEDKLFTVDKNNYDKVIYVKEITRVQYVDSLVYYLKEILKVLYSMPTRLVVVESFYASGKPAVYPDLVPHYALKEKDVISGDILMLGIQPKLLQDVLRNPTNISILIVLDRGGYKIPHIKGKNVEYLYTASDLDDVPPDVPKSRIISYSEDSLYIPLIKGFKELDKGERISKYSSTTIMKKLVALIEGR